MKRIAVVARPSKLGSQLIEVLSVSDGHNICRLTRQGLTYMAGITEKVV